MSEFEYVGSELELFAQATNWKSYQQVRISRFLDQHVLEVGAGLGATTRQLIGPGCQRWVCLEPDRQLAGRLQETIEAGQLPPCCELCVGTLADVPQGQQFDTILYIDVLEHIEDDAGELQRAAERLSPSGRLVVLAPAHQWLYTPFDRAIGHFRRYNRRMLLSLTPQKLEPVCVEYLDSCGVLASLGNRLLLRRATPTPAQIGFWDRMLVPLSQLFDPLTGRRIGKSILAVWQQTPGASS